MKALTELLRTFDAALMKRYVVGTRINFVKTADPECTALQVGNTTTAPS